jgi:hypothetical protein
MRVAISAYFSMSASAGPSQVDSVAKVAMWSLVIWAAIPLNSPAFCFSRIRAVFPGSRVLE